ASFIGVQGVGGASLSNGKLAMLLGSTASGGTGYAMQGEANVVVDTPVVDMAGKIRLLGNTLGRAVDQQFTVASTTLTMHYDATILPAKVELGDLDAMLTDTLGDVVTSVSGVVVDLKNAITPQYDTGGNPINSHPMARELPILGTSLSQLIGADKLLGIGDYTQRYLALPTPTLRGLLTYLQDNWLPTMGAARDALQLVMGTTGLEFSFANVFSMTSTTSLRLDNEALGLDLDGEVKVNVKADIDVAFRMSVDWIQGTGTFTLDRLDVQARALVGDIDVTAALGPLAVSLGDRARQTGTLSLALGGSVVQGANGLDFIQNTDSLSVYLPVYAELGGLDLTAGQTPALRMSGNPFAGKVTVSTENFDKIGDFSRISVMDLILMFPDFVDALESVREDGRLAATIPFVESGLDQVLQFADGFEQSVYNKIDFNKPRVDLLTFASATVVPMTINGQSVSVVVNPFGGMDANLLRDQEVSLYKIVAGRDVWQGTYTIKDVLDGKKLVLSGAADAGIGMKAVVHQPRVKITTLQEFMDAVNRSGVLPYGMQVRFDPVQRSLVIPLHFREAFTPVDTALALDLGSDQFTLSTSARGSLTAFVEGNVDFFFDLDGRTLFGKTGSLSAGQALFSDATFLFDSTMVGYTLEIDGEKYTVTGMRDAHELVLDRAAGKAVASQGYTLRQDKFQLGIENLVLAGGVSLDAQDLEVGLKMGFLSAKAGGAGSGSSVHAGITAGITLDRNPGSSNPFDRRFSFSEVTGSALHFQRNADAVARLKGLRVDPGIGSEIPLAPNIEIAIHAQDPFLPGAVKVINQNPMYAADLNALRQAGTIQANDTVVILPDLGSMFDFKKLSFADIVEGVRMGLESLRDSLESQPFYNVVFPVVGRSMADTFPFVDQVLAKLENAARQPAETIGVVEGIIEEALGIQDDNRLSAQDQMFSLSLNGETLDIHLNVGQLFTERFGFSLDLQQLAAIAGPGTLAGLDFADSLADVINPGASGKITLSMLAKLQVEAGIDFSGSSPDFFLYDFDPTRIQSLAVAAFGSVAFAKNRSEVDDKGYARILADFRGLLTNLGGGVERLSAEVNAAYITPEETDNRDLVNGAGQLAGRRQAAVVALAGRLSDALGVRVDLFAGKHVSQKLFDQVKAYRKVDVAPEQARGTYATVGMRVAGQDLELGFDAGPAKIGVQHGWAAIDRDGNAGTVDYATFTVKLDQKSAVNDDGRFHVGREKLSANLGTVIEGAFGMDLPVRLDFSAGSLQLGDFTATTAAGLKGFIDGAAGLVTQTPALTLHVPNVQEMMDNFLDEFSLLGMLNDPNRLLDGIDSALGSVQDVLGGETERNIPIIGSQLRDVGNFVKDIRVGLLGDLRHKLSAEGGAIGIARSSLYDLFTSAGILRDLDGNNVINVNDVQVGWFDRGGSFISAWDGGQLPVQADAIQFNMKLGKTLVAAGVDIPLAFDLPGFDFKVNGGFNLDMSWTYDFGFGLSTSSGFYLATHSGVQAADPELRIDATASLKGQNGQPFSASGSLLFFSASVTDLGRSGGRASGTDVVLGIDFKGDSRGRLSADKIFSQATSRSFGVVFKVDTDIRLLTARLPMLKVKPVVTREKS
ncbi:MAG: hypothetical protein HQM03_21820, partial [Magnetococcales bacterium]|nr:hypothetical protein [Magnetococcales bacterium]